MTQTQTINPENLEVGAKHRAVLNTALKDKTQFKVAIVYPITADSIGDLITAQELGLVTPVFIGPIDTMEKIAKELGKNLTDYECIDATTPELAAKIAVELSKENKVKSIMKADIKTDDLFHPIVASNTGIRTDKRISHCTFLDIPTYEKLMIFTDCAVNTYPNTNEKKDIIQNAIDFAIILGINNPKVAILAAVETVTDKMPNTLEAKTLTEISQRGEIQGGVVYGPLAFDDAISKKASAAKHIKSHVAGDADIFLMPNIEMGNNLAKALRYLAEGIYVGIVVGAKVPIIVLSRFTTTAERILSTAYVKMYATKTMNQSEEK